MKHNAARFRLVVDGVDYAAALTPRLIALSLTEKLEDGADELSVTLSNHIDRDGRRLPAIRRGRIITLALGWASGPDVKAGLVEKGRFRIDQVEKNGPPDVVQITARSADLTGAMRTRKDKGWKGKTLRAIVDEVAGANGLAGQCHIDLADITLPSAEQAAKSDIAFIRDLGRRHDAVATVKDGRLLFLPIGAATNAGGKALARLALKRRDNSRYRFTAADRQEHDGASAQWHDGKAGHKRTVTHGPGKNPRRIKRDFASEEEARAATRAEAKRATRGQYTLNYEMALGDATVSPNARATVSGFDAEIDGIDWLVRQVSHTLDGGGGFRTALELDSI